MPGNSAEVAIVGAGPAGAHLASLLAVEGRDVVLFDPKGAWEKPCGGGVVARALREFSFLLEDSKYPKKLISRIKLISPGGSCVRLKVDQPFAVYSRRVLNGLVLDRAIEEGAHFVRAGVRDVGRDGDGWKLTSEDALTNEVKSWRARFLVGADGAASSTRRRLVGFFEKQDLALAFGYNVIEPDETRNVSVSVADEVVVSFPINFTGYLWAFPRPGVMNFGIASKLGERTSADLREMLTRFVADYYGGEVPGSARAEFFGAKIPTLDAETWRNLRATGDGWALAGDAAGFCDPITGEGIYYAFKSAELLADALACNVDSGYQQATASYERLWREQIGGELERASRILPRFYRGRFFGHMFTDAMVRLSKFHRGTAKILMRALIGDQSYITLKQDLLRNAWRLL